MFEKPLAYFITFTTYGTWLHGDPRKSIIRRNGKTEMIDSNPALYRHERLRLKYRPIKLETESQIIVRDAILDLCAIRKWHLFALHVRSNHVHTIIRADCPVDLVTNHLKRWPTRKLREGGFDGHKVWTSGSSKKYIYKPEKLQEKVHYVIYEQGTMMAHYVDGRFGK